LQQLHEVLLIDPVVLHIKFRRNGKGEAQFVLFEQSPAHFDLNLGQELSPNRLDPYLLVGVDFGLLDGLFEEFFVPLQALLLHVVQLGKVDKDEED